MDFNGISMVFLVHGIRKTVVSITSKFTPYLQGRNVHLWKEFLSSRSNRFRVIVHQKSHLCLLRSIIHQGRTAPWRMTTALSRCVMFRATVDAWAEMLLHCSTGHAVYLVNGIRKTVGSITSKFTPYLQGPNLHLWKEFLSSRSKVKVTVIF